MKDLGEFPPAAKNKDGRASYCRPCMRVRHRTYRDARQGAAPVRRTRARATSAEVKWCSSCQSEKPRTEFGRNRASADGLTGYCKPCHNAKGKATYIRLYGSTREYHLRRRYGIGVVEFDAMVEAQGGVCALCRDRKPEHVDHDHLTKKIRGVLCSCCNQGLGNFRDSIASLKAAIDYLETSTWQKSRVCTGVYRLTSPRRAARPSPTSSALLHLISSHHAAVTSRPA
jgi:hypothetical protein